MLWYSTAVLTLRILQQCIKYDVVVIQFQLLTRKLFIRRMKYLTPTD